MVTCVWYWSPRPAQALVTHPRIHHLIPSLVLRITVLYSRLRMNERESFKLAVDEMMGTLTGSLHTVIDELILKLYACFTEGERQQIQHPNRTKIQMVEEFFKTLKTKGVEVYKKCLTAMEELKHPDLARMLREKWKCAVDGAGPTVHVARKVAYIDHDID